METNKDRSRRGQDDRRIRGNSEKRHFRGAVDRVRPVRGKGEAGGEGD